MIQTICVCGAGTMGNGIAQLCAQAGFHTLLYDIAPIVLQQGKATIEKNLASLESKNKITALQKTTSISLLHYISEINDCIADIFIEAIVEKVTIKIGLLNQLAEVNHSEVIFATNTSSLSVSTIAAGVMHPSRVVGMHFFNPAPLMKLVEVVKAPQTKKEVLDTVISLAKQLGKIPVVCKDAPGFIVNHVARPYYLEALKLVEEGVTTIETIDQLMEASGFKMGPFKLMDLIGNDINYAVSCSVYEQMGNPLRLKPSLIQQQKVTNGELGKKTGKGYYLYK
ncbi:MAG: 3-hydroxyacyl-CoA dehydrogenase family protein [Chitinophagaceae bacterium]